MSQPLSLIGPKNILEIVIFFRITTLLYPDRNGILTSGEVTADAGSLFFLNDSPETLEKLAGKRDFNLNTTIDFCFHFLLVQRAEQREKNTLMNFHDSFTANAMRIISRKNTKILN